ncbi:MAG TPA: phosphate uptake regulator PhoU [Thermoplasmata archaeon]|nr:phosphate uptake regulator PhoU [Thermoplasmata archaeon]
MEGRKLQLAGKSTFLVSLPKRWVTNAGLKPGDTLFVDTESDGSVSVRPRSGERPQIRRKIFVEKGEESRDHLLRKLIGAYVTGFGLIEIRFTPDRGPFVRRVAREFCRLVIGPEVIEENRNAIVVQDLSDPTELSSEKCLRRMHLTVRTMLEDAILALKTGDESLAHDVDLRGQDVNRLYWMVAKQYHLAHSAPLPASDRATAAVIHGHRLIAKILERIGHHAQRIAGTYATLSEARTLDPKLWKEIEDVRNSAVAILDKSFNSLVTRDIEGANQAIDSRIDHQGLVDSLAHRVSTRKGQELLALGAIVDSLGRTAAYAAEIAEETIDLAVLTNPENS